MSTTATHVSIHRNQNAGTAFTVVERKVPCQHKFQFYMDYGATDMGPWMKVGINDTEFGFGYLPSPKENELRVAPKET